jgi:acyl-coenzyme A thioesterase PaaI-like protein
VAASGLELTASAAFDAGSTDGFFRTASVRVNFLRPFIAGTNSRYIGTPHRIGRSTAVGDAQAVGDDGRVAITARVTAYR